MTTDKNTDNYSRLQTKLNDFEILLQQMVFIDRAQDQNELNAATQALIRVIGDYTQANRVYIFDKEPDSDTYRNSFEWCAPGITAWIDNLQAVSASKMPYWQSAFERGENIIIDDVESVKKLMPSEYAMLKIQDIQTEIAFPIYSQNQLCGFIGLDNPQIARSQSFISLLAVVGGHLGNARKNIRMAALLEQKRDSLQKSNHELEREKLYLSVLCIDYTSVYCVDLARETVEIIKLDSISNIARETAFSQNRTLNYQTMLKSYYDQYVYKETAPDFLEVLSIPNIKLSLSQNNRLIYHYQSIPNLAGQEYFEIQVVPLSDTLHESKVIIGFRHIDDIVKEEQAQKRKLQEALDEAQLNNEIISAISKVYFAIYRIDLREDFYEEISSDNEVHRLTGRIGKASAKMVELCDTFVAPAYHDSVMKFFDLSTLADRLKNDEVIDIDYLAKDGNWHLARFIVKKRDEKGTVTHVLYVTRLISEQKRREQNWIFIAEEANRANVAKSDFLSRIAHDIRTPMNAVLGFVDITKKHLDEPEKVKTGLDKIQLAGSYIEQLVNDILDIASIENGKMELHPETVNIADILEDFSDTLQASIVAKHLTYNCKKHNIDHPYLTVDSLRLKQIYMNLLSNSIKYTPEWGSITFEFYEEPSATAGRTTLVAIISDTGIGIDPEYMEHMYQAFSREVDTRVNKVRGSGLGLAIVKQLVDLMNGTIRVESTVGKGTSFHIELELPYTTPSVSGESAEASDSPDPTTSCNGMHLLIAEDNDLNYEVVSELLRMYHISCERAENGAICVDKFSASGPDTYDAILMDMQMPVMDGPEAAQVIRALTRPDAQTIPIIAITANAFTRDIERCLAAGMNEHLSKPLNVHQLLAILDKYKSTA